VNPGVLQVGHTLRSPWSAFSLSTPEVQYLNCDRGILCDFVLSGEGFKILYPFASHLTGGLLIR